MTHMSSTCLALELQSFSLRRVTRCGQFCAPEISAWMHLLRLRTKAPQSMDACSSSSEREAEEDSGEARMFLCEEKRSLEGENASHDQSHCCDSLG